MKMVIMVPERNLDNTSPHAPSTVRQCLVEDTVAPLPVRRCSHDFQEEKKDPMTPTRNKDGDTISNAKPTIETIPCPPLLRRVQSERTPQRRSIFPNCWQPGVPTRRQRSNSDATNSNCPSTPLAPTKVSTISIPERLSPKVKEIDISQLTPPNLCTSISSEHFRPVKEMPKHIASELPRIPYPLKRFFDEDGKGACLNGAYPLNSPQPILRQSTYTNMNSEGESSHFGSFNLTQTNHGFDGSGRDANSSSVGRRSSSFSSSNSEKRHVQFDPRVTVTEYFDEVERQWFSDAELDRFRNQTIFVAQQYLLKHPEKITDYSNPVLDPVTKTMRKKALFSLEVFHIEGNTGSDTEDAEAVVDEVGRANAKQLAGQEVRKILIVDRNALIVNLFYRSMQALFPAARISTFQTAEEALEAYERAKCNAPHVLARSFDLVIAEEKLDKPLQRIRWSLRGGNKTRSIPSNLSDGRSTALESWGSLNNLSTIEEKPSMSGSELFQKINSTDESFLKDSSRQQATSKSPLEMSSLIPIHWQPLLIGVSMQPAEDASKFFNSGADFVWGKPPPTMNDTLRDQLVASLVKKRGEGGLTCPRC